MARRMITNSSRDAPRVPRRRHRPGLAALVAGALLSCVLPASAAPDLHYDSTACRTDAGGRIFLRFIGGYQFAFPTGIRMHLGNPPPDDTGLPRDEAEPEGCPDNPVMVGGITLAWTSAMGDPAAGRLEPGWRVHRLRVRSGPTRPLESNHRSYLSTLHQALKIGGPYKWALRPPSKTGVVAIRPTVIPDGHAETPEQSMSYLMAAPGAHEGGDLPLVARCSLEFTSSGKYCSGYSRLRCDLGIGYRFSTRHVPENDLIALDSQIRAFLRRHALPGTDLSVQNDCPQPG